MKCVEGSTAYFVNQVNFLLCGLDYFWQLAMSTAWYICSLLDYIILMMAPVGCTVQRMFSAQLFFVVNLFQSNETGISLFLLKKELTQLSVAQA